MSGAPASFNLADIWEWVAGRVPSNLALVCGEQRRTYSELEANANRAANYLSEQGIGVGDRVALVLKNCSEYIELMLGAFKLRAVPVNVNFRYVAGELSDVLARSDVKLIMCHRSLSEAVDAARPLGVHLAVIEDLNGVSGSAPLAAGVGDYLRAVEHTSEEAPINPFRSGDDHYLMLTGGTTGAPKAVLWRHEDAFYACLGGGDPLRLSGPIGNLSELEGRLAETFTFLPVAPLMHAAAQWTTFMWLFAGAKVVLMPGSFDPLEVWKAVEDEQVNMLTLVGDAMAKPLLAALEADPERFDTSSLFAISNGAAPLSSAIRARLAAQFPKCVITDGIGSSESGIQGAARSQPRSAHDSKERADPSGFNLNPSTVVLDDAGHPVTPGSGAIGRLATSGHLPLGYDGDPELTAATFPTFGGVRYVVAGDLASVGSDGSITLLGRGSGCINSGGEKVFPEEVEGVLQGLAGIADVVVIGVADERWGSTVTAVVEAIDPAKHPSLEELQQHCRSQLAGYKIPRRVVFVERVPRTPAGKADYRAAQQAVEKNRNDVSGIHT